MLPRTSSRQTDNELSTVLAAFGAMQRRAFVLMGLHGANQEVQLTLRALRFASIRQYP